jgi:transposase
MLGKIDIVPPTDLDREIFDATILADHYLRRVKTLIDFERFRSSLIPCYSITLGRPAFEPLMLLKLEFLRYHYGLSDREVIEQCRVNMAYRFFLDLSLHSDLPDPSTLCYFRSRIGVETFQKVFQDLIAQAREMGLVKDRLRLKDATHILANIAVPSTLRLVAQTRTRLLEAARPLAPDRVAVEEAEAARVRVATSDLADQGRLLHRVTHLRTIVAWVEDLLKNGEPPNSAGDLHWLRLREALDLAHKVLHDRDDPKAPDKVISVEDPEARNGWHHQWFAGYLLDVSMDADSEFVTALDVLPPSGDEAANATALIEQEEKAQGNDVAALSIDSVGFRGDLLVEWTDPQGLNLEVIVPPKEPPASSGFTPETFTLNADGDELTCPAGETTSRRDRNSHDTGWKYRFAPEQCAGCSLREKCLREPATTKSRYVIKNDYEAAYRTAKEKAKTERYREMRRQHPRIERKLGEMVRWHDARHARSRGRAQVLIQMLVTGLVVNVKRFVKLVGGSDRAGMGAARAVATSG